MALALKIFSVIKFNRKAFSMPSTRQLLVSGFLWFLVSVAFQAAEVYRVAGYLNIADTAISSCLLLVAIFFIYILQRFAAGYFNNLFTRIGLTGILIFKIVYVQYFLTRHFFDAASQAVFTETLLIRVFSSFLVISFFSFILWLVFHLKKMSQEAVFEQKAESALRDAELMKLRQQIQPHFLFNSLNSINALVGSEPGLARKMIENLSDFLRGTLKKDENRPVHFSEEMQLLKLYLDIEKVRFGDRLKITFQIEPALLEKTVPPLILQPIVENAIKFGLYNVLNEVEIKVSAFMRDNALVILVSNPFDEKTTTRKGEGFGLSLIHRRLQLIYHRADLLKTESKNGIFETTVIIPQP